MSNFLRSCAGCSAHILTNDPTSQKVFCPTCKPKHVTPFESWAASVKVGDTVYVQPYAAFRGLSHSQYLVIERTGDDLTLQVLGWPESRTVTHINHCGQFDLTPRR